MAGLLRPAKGRALTAGRGSRACGRPEPVDPDRVGIPPVDKLAIRSDRWRACTVARRYEQWRRLAPAAAQSDPDHGARSTSDLTFLTARFYPTHMIILAEIVAFLTVFGLMSLLVRRGWFDKGILVPIGTMLGGIVIASVAVTISRGAS